MINSKKSIIIIGGGTSGITIANRLQEKFDVEVIERSTHQNVPFIYRIPLLIGILFRKKKQNFILQKQIKLKSGRLITFWVTKVFGGASVINGCVHVFGGIKSWKRLLNSFDFNLDDLKDSYNFVYTNKPNEKGKIKIRESSTSKIDEIFFSALKYKGLEFKNMTNSNDEGFGPIHNTSNKFYRSSVLSLLKKKSFRLSMGKDVNYISYDPNSDKIKVHCKDELISPDYVIICAGVIGSYELLLNSQKQIGNIDPDLGTSVRDHANLRINILTRTNIGSLNEIDRSLSKKTLLFIKHMFGLPSVMSGTGATSGVHLDLDNDGEIDTRIQVVQFSEQGRHGSDGKFFNSEPGFSFSITPIRPRSKGKMYKENNETRIDPNYLSANSDIELLQKGLAFCLSLLKTSPFSSIVKEIINEELLRNNPAEYIRENIFSGAHLIGGVSSLINSDLSLKKTPRTFICDASVFSDYASSNIHSTVVLLSDMFAKNFIKKFYNS